MLIGIFYNIILAFLIRNIMLKSNELASFLNLKVITHILFMYVSIKYILKDY